MKNVTFFNEKGGVGKTTLNTLFACYLAYGCGKRVKLYDFDAPDFRVQAQRDTDLLFLKDGASWLSQAVAAGNPGRRFFEIANIGVPLTECTAEVCETFKRSIWEDFLSGAYDYLVFDFPAGFGRTAPATALCAARLVDLMVIPMDTFSQTKKAAVFVHDMAVKTGTPSLMLWNNIPNIDMNNGMMDSNEKFFAETYGCTFAPQRIKQFTKARRDSSMRYFVSNTLCWPEDNVVRNCPEMPALFAHVRDILDRGNQ